jgi:hypothetical protein
LASVKIIGMRVFSAAVTNGPSSRRNASTAASAFLCSPDLTTISNILSDLIIYYAFNCNKPLIYLVRPGAVLGDGAV